MYLFSMKNVYIQFYFMNYECEKKLINIVVKDITQVKLLNKFITIDYRLLPTGYTDCDVYRV